MGLERHIEEVVERDDPYLLNRMWFKDGNIYVTEDVLAIRLATVLMESGEFEEGAWLRILVDPKEGVS